MSAFQIISPGDGSLYAERDYASSNEVEGALITGTNSFENWRKSSLADRKAICTKVIEYFIEHIDELSLELTKMMGRPIKYSPLEITGGFRERAEYMISISDEALASIQPEKKTGFDRFIRKEPIGVVLVLCPWNYPYLTAVNAVIPAILAGNCVILKHADQTAICAERFGAAFDYAGLPQGVFQYLHMTHDQVAEIVADERVSHVAFTGSVTGGHAIKDAVNQRFISVGLELGGKDAAYVCDDADLSSTIDNLVDGSYFNSGQSCCAVERIYIHEEVYDVFVNAFAQRVLELHMGDPLSDEVSLGPLVRPSATEKVKAQVEDALAKGAKTLIDESCFPGHLGPAYMVPQVLVAVDHSMDIMTSETFGPVAAIMKVSGDEEAVSLINDSQYGLTASIWTANVDRAIALGERIETGTVFMNRCDYLDPALAWTGIKDSGNGCTLSKKGFDQFVRLKSYHMRLS